jgi:hypothetical protein
MKITPLKAYRYFARFLAKEYSKYVKKTQEKQ